MDRLLVNAGITVLANALALVVGSLLIDGFSLDVAGFAIALLIFTVVQVLLEPVLRSVAKDRAPLLVGLSALIATLVSLVVTSIVADGLDIDGVLTWVIVAAVVWAIALVAKLIMAKLLFRSLLEGDPT